MMVLLPPCMLSAMGVVLVIGPLVVAKDTGVGAVLA
jgi:hypothetical protein